MMASIPCTAAANAAADRGGADLVAVQARARLPWAAERRVHDQVHLTGEYPRHHGRLAVRAWAVAVLSHDLGTNPVAAQHLRRSLGGPDLEAQVGEALDREDHRPLVPVGHRHERPPF